METLDLHYVKEDVDLGISAEGILCKNMDDIIDRVSKVKDTVEEINFDSQAALKELPAVLSECKQLKKLNISHTGIKGIPDFIFSLPALQILSCRCSEISEFPLAIFKIEKLENLHLRINKKWTIPDKIPLLPNLKILDLDIYSSAALPENLGALKNLEELSLSVKYDEGTVPELPASFKNHGSLKKLSVTDPFYKNRKNFDLDKAVKILASCPKIESLRLSGLSVGNGHQNFSKLKGLKVLELRHLLLEGKIFDSITGLNQLEELYIWGSEFKISEIPDIFTDMKELQVFSFAGNMVLDLPASIYNLSKLKVLEIGSTGISELDDKIGSLVNLETIQVYDNILEKLPVSILSLPKLKIFNIEENIFNANTINAIKGAISALAQKGQKIQFMFDRQGHRQMVKKLRAIKNIDSMNVEVYAKYCLNAINENPYAIKYVNTKKLEGSRFYADLCIAAVKKTCFTLEIINSEILGRQYYFICIEAARSPDIANGFKLINEKALTDNEYIQVCIEAALHNRSEYFIDNINNETFQKRFDREIYERICWVAVLHYPRTISKMISPPNDFHKLAASRAK
jgi:Leucine-rich repeat (LRR) protein